MKLLDICLDTEKVLVLTFLILYVPTDKSFNIGFRKLFLKEQKQNFNSVCPITSHSPKNILLLQQSLDKKNYFIKMQN